jgi:hypothetical protein
MTSMSPESRAIIDAARAGEDLGDATRARTKQRLMLAAGLAAGATAAATEAAAATAAGAIPMVSGMATAFKVGAALLFAAAVGVGAQQVAAPDAPVAEAHGGVAAIASSIAQATPPPVVDTTVVEPVGDVPPAPPASEAKIPRAASSSIAEETELLARAQRALGAGNADEALALLEQHKTEHQRGALSEEREAAQVLALCGAGRVDEARVAAQRFASAHPRSPHRVRVLAACAP